MQNFEYANPSSLKEATALLGASWADAQVLAGGTDLISLMKDYIETPRRVVTIKNIKELGGISASKGGLRIGATVTFEELANNAAVRTQYPSLASAVRGVTSPQIRNMGTVGGDLCQRPRCWYYRNGNGLLAMKDGKSLVSGGENRYHAIFGDSSHVADLRARYAANRRGKRRVVRADCGIVRQLLERDCRADAQSAL